MTPALRTRWQRLSDRFGFGLHDPAAESLLIKVGAKPGLEFFERPLGFRADPQEMVEELLRVAVHRCLDALIKEQLGKQGLGQTGNLGRFGPVSQVGRELHLVFKGMRGVSHVVLQGIR